MYDTEEETKELAKSIGKAIARQRLSAHLTQEEVATSLGVGNEAVSRMERGVVIPTVTRIIELAQLFRCDAASLLEEASNRPIEQALYIEKQISQLDQKDRAMVVTMVEILCERLSRPSSF